MVGVGSDLDEDVVVERLDGRGNADDVLKVVLKWRVGSGTAARLRRWYSPSMDMSNT